MRAHLIQTALNLRLPDLVLKNARIINVFSGRITPGDVAISDGVIAGVGDYPAGQITVDLGGKLLSPGLINAHCHVESSMAAPAAYCREELRWGVTTLITDPHEIANVAGAQGVRYMLDSARGLPINYLVQLPSCVPSTPFEHSGCALDADALAQLRNLPGVLGLGEMMNYPGVLACDAQVLTKLERFAGAPIDGHAPGLTGRELQGYIAAGIGTDHESTTYAEALEKLEAGMAVLVREGSASRNLTDILTGVVQDSVDTSHMAFCSDDLHLADLHERGSIRHNLHRAMALGLAPGAAFRMATLNAAQIFSLEGLGAVAVGYKADLVVFDDLEHLRVEAVYKDGMAVNLDADFARQPALPSPSVHLGMLADSIFDFNLSAAATHPVVGLLPGQILTRRLEYTVSQIEAGLQDGSLCKLAVIERHHATGSVGLGLLAGYGLHGGAIATTVAHDSHNLLVVGDNDADMRLATAELTRLGGGYAVVSGGRILGSLALPVYGLMSPLPAPQIIEELRTMIDLARRMGVGDGIDPFITLSFLALPVLPELRVTDMGLFDVTHFSFVEL